MALPHLCFLAPEMFLWDKRAGNHDFELRHKAIIGRRCTAVPVCWWKEATLLPSNFQGGRTAP